MGGFPKGNLDTEMSSFAHSGDEIKKLRKLIDVLKGDKNFLTKLEKTLSAVKAITNFYKSGKQVRLAVDEYLKASNSMTEESGRFFKKGVIYYDEDFRDNIERTSDTTGQRTDKDAKDTLRSSK